MLSIPYRACCLFHIEHAVYSSPQSSPPPPPPCAGGGGCPRGGQFSGPPHTTLAAGPHAGPGRVSVGPPRAAAARTATAECGLRGAPRSRSAQQHPAQTAPRTVTPHPAQYPPAPTRSPPARSYPQARGVSAGCCPAMAAAGCCPVLPGHQVLPGHPAIQPARMSRTRSPHRARTRPGPARPYPPSPLSSKLGANTPHLPAPHPTGARRVSANAQLLRGAALTLKPSARPPARLSPRAVTGRAARV